MITVESDNMWCGSSPVGKSRKLSRHRDPCWGQFQDTLRRLERTPCPAPAQPCHQHSLLQQKRTDKKVNRNFKLTKSDNYLFCLVPSTSHTKVSIKAENHQPETDRCGTFWLNTRPKVSHIELIYGPMQSIIGILSSVFSILWGALASATASRKKRCLSAEIRGWLDNGPRLLWSAARTNARYWPTSKAKRLHQGRKLRKSKDVI